MLNHTGPNADRSTIMFNPFRKSWVFSIKQDKGYSKTDPSQNLGRSRRYWEVDDLVRGGRWTAEQPYDWVSADDLDIPVGCNSPSCPVSQLYALDGVGYESLMVGLFTIFNGKYCGPLSPFNRTGEWDSVFLGFSRDGFWWTRPVVDGRHRVFLPMSDEPAPPWRWNKANVQSVGGGFVVLEDMLRFYVGARTGPDQIMGNASVGIAEIRRDGFAALSVGATSASGTVVTRVLTFDGSFLHVNVGLKGGQPGAVCAEVLRAHAPQVIDPFSLDACVPVSTDSTRARIAWGAAAVPANLSAIAGIPVRFRFHLSGAAQLYSFWVSRTLCGESRGYVAAGGAGFEGNMDTRGSCRHVADAAASGTSAKTDDQTVQVDWGTAENWSVPESTFQIVTDPFLIRGSPTHDRLWQYVNASGSHYIRLQAWAPYPQYGVPALHPPAKSPGGQCTTSWDFAKLESLFEDFWKSACIGGRKCVINLSCSPSWMWVNGTNVSQLPHNPNQKTHPHKVYMDGYVPVDPTWTQLGEYFGRVIAWFRSGGFTDECGVRHTSGHRYAIPFFEVLNEMEHIWSRRAADKDAPKEYTRLFDAVARGIIKYQRADDPPIRLVGLGGGLTYLPPSFAFTEALLSRSQHLDMLGMVSAHDYSVVADYTVASLESVFHQIDHFVERLREAVDVKDKLAPHVKAIVDEFGTNFHGCGTDECQGYPQPGSKLDRRFQSLAAAAFAYGWAQFGRNGADSVGCSQYNGYFASPQNPLYLKNEFGEATLTDTYYPALSMYDYRSGLPQPRYWAMRMLHEELTVPGCRPVITHCNATGLLAQGFVCGADSKLLLVSKTASTQSVSVEPYTPSSALLVQRDGRAAEPPQTIRLSGHTVALPGFGVATVALDKLDEDAHRFSLRRKHDDEAWGGEPETMQQFLGHIYATPGGKSAGNVQISFFNQPDGAVGYCFQSSPAASDSQGQYCMTSNTSGRTWSAAAKVHNAPVPPNGTRYSGPPKLEWNGETGANASAAALWSFYPLGTFSAGPVAWHGQRFVFEKPAPGESMKQIWAGENGGGISGVTRLTHGPHAGRILTSWQWDTHGILFMYSDDSGRSWKNSSNSAIITPQGNPPLGDHWGGCEPNAVELSDGRVLALIRAMITPSEGVLWEALSSSQGERFDGPPRRTDLISFRSPMLLRRVRIAGHSPDPIVLVFNNGRPADDHVGSGETDRAILHAAISEDDAQTWTGFREVLRDDKIKANVAGDHGTAYPEGVVARDGTMIVQSGQGHGRWSAFRFRPEWLLETSQTADWTSPAAVNDWNSSSNYGGNFASGCTARPSDPANGISIAGRAIHCAECTGKDFDPQMHRWAFFQPHVGSSYVYVFQHDVLPKCGDVCGVGWNPCAADVELTPEEFKRIQLVNWRNRSGFEAWLNSSLLSRGDGRTTNRFNCSQLNAAPNPRLPCAEHDGVAVRAPRVQASASNAPPRALCAAMDANASSAGFSWNFPASRSGILDLRMLIEAEGFAGAHIALSDHWEPAVSPRPNCAPLPPPPL